MLSVSQAAEKWNCKEEMVRACCASYVIPPAEKIKGRWQIPDEWPKPPMRRRGLCFLLDTIYQLNHGVSFGALKWGYSEEDVKRGYEYLVSAAFMSTIDTDDLPHTLAGATVTKRGEELIRRENEERKDGAHFKAHVTAKATVGVASVEGGVEVSK